MIKRKILGQHFLNSNFIAQSIVSEAKIKKNDTVFELGTGLGVLTPLLCKNAEKVISVDADAELIKNAKLSFGKIKNLTLKTGDGFKKKDSFSIFVSNLPYSKSKEAIEWLSQRTFSHGVIMVQKEFADKLKAKDSDRKAISIIADHCFEIKTLFKVGKNNFTPPPKVDSVILKIIKKSTLSKDQINSINKIFSYRRKTIKNILKQFAIESKIDKRIDKLSGDEIINLANKILEK